MTSRGAGRTPARHPPHPPLDPPRPAHMPPPPPLCLLSNSRLCTARALTHVQGAAAAAGRGAAGRHGGRHGARRPAPGLPPAAPAARQEAGGGGGGRARRGGHAAGHGALGSLPGGLLGWVRSGRGVQGGLVGGGTIRRHWEAALPSCWPERRPLGLATPLLPCPVHLTSCLRRRLCVLGRAHKLPGRRAHDGVARHGGGCAGQH